MTVSDSQSDSQSPVRHTRRSGLTLVEIMIALTMTLIVLGAMMSAFRYASEKMQLGRAVMEMANRLRVAEEFLRDDLANLTLDPRPHTESAAPNGFLEIIEGGNSDSFYLGDDAIGFYGDIDDSIGMTCRSPDGQKFRGSIIDANGVNQARESTMAEIWYFTTVTEPGDFNAAGEPTVYAGVATLNFEDKVRLHRRVLLIRPDMGTVASNISFDDVAAFISTNDLSVHVQANANGTYNLVANNVADLAERRNRFVHMFARSTGSGPVYDQSFPNLFARPLVAAGFVKPEGGDILLTDVAGFNLKVYSPNVKIQNTGSLLVEPSDLGYDFTRTNGVLAGNTVGGFVDLGNGADGWFSGAATTESQLGATYDTWTPFYEHDGFNQDGDTFDHDNNPNTAELPLIDEGTNGLDNGGTAALDDDLERETRPPYPYPLRGVEVSLRLIEKNTQQVYQTSVVQSYVPE